MSFSLPLFCHCERSEATEAISVLTFLSLRAKRSNRLFPSSHCERSEAIAFSHQVIANEVKQSPFLFLPLFFCHCEAVYFTTVAIAFNAFFFAFFCHCEAMLLHYMAVAISILTFICHRKRFNQHYLSCHCEGVKRPWQSPLISFSLPFFCHCERSEAIFSLRFPFFYCKRNKYSLFQYLLKVHQNNQLFKFRLQIIQPSLNPHSVTPFNSVKTLFILTFMVNYLISLFFTLSKTALQTHEKGEVRIFTQNDPELRVYDMFLQKSPKFTDKMWLLRHQYKFLRT